MRLGGSRGNRGGRVLVVKPTEKGQVRAWAIAGLYHGGLVRYRPSSWIYDRDLKYGDI